MVANSLDQLRTSLLSPDYAVAFIIGNNPEAVADNVRQMGFIASDADGIVRALNAMLADGRGEDFIQALSVPVRTDRLTAEELAVLGEQSVAISRAYGKAATGSNSYKDESGGFNWNALFGGLASGTLAYLQLNGANQVNPGAAQPTTPPPAKDNTLTWVLGGIAVIVLVVVVVIAIKASKKAA